MALVPPKRDEVKLLVESVRNGRRIPADVLVGTGASVLAEYPALQAVAVPLVAYDQFTSRLTRAGFAYTELQEFIRTPRRSIDPRVEEPPRTPFDAGLYLVQYVAPPPPSWESAVRQTGVIRIDSLPERAMIVSANARQMDSVAKLPWVQFASPYLPPYKYGPASTGIGEFMIQIAATADAAETITRVRQRVGGFVVESRHGAQLTAVVRTDLGTARTLLNEPFVIAVETYFPPQASDERQALSVTGTTVPSGDYLNWLAQRGITTTNLTNSGIIIDIADTGLDNGCSTPENADLQGRKAYLKGPYFPSERDVSRHGTIIAGIAAGVPVYGVKDNDNGSFYYGVGVAPGVRIGSTRFYRAGGGSAGGVKDWTKSGVASVCMQPNSLCVDTFPAQICTATVQSYSSNQYDGTGSNAGVYTLQAREFDISVRDADWDTTTQYEPLAIVISAGNFRAQAESSKMVMASGTAKNVITMGAAESRRTGITPVCPYSGENHTLREMAEGYNVLAYLSRRGTIDNRLKPELLAPATQALGASSFTTSGYYCLTAGDPGQPNYPQYNGQSGTSFASPVAAGAIALLRYYCSVNYGLTPSPALYKAMLVAGGRSISGAIDRLETQLAVEAGQPSPVYVGVWPNTQQGFGILTLNDLLSTTPAKAFHNQGTVLTQGQYYERSVRVADPTKPVRIVLAWTDAPAAASAPIALVNNLDLTATWPDFYRLYGNYFDTYGWSRTGAGCGRPSCPSPADLRNNVEMLNINPSRFADPANHVFTIRVMASPINGIGVPGQSGGANNQDFALFVLNGTFQ